MTNRIAYLAAAAALAVACLGSVARASEPSDEATFTTLYSFEAPAPVTFTSLLGSQPDTTPVIGPGGDIYGMTMVGGQFGNGVIYRFDRNKHQYTVLHTFSALDANGNNEDGAIPGNALTAGPGGVFYGTAQFGGMNGSGTIFKITTKGDFTVLHTFSALDANGHNQDGASPLRNVVIGKDGKLYGTNRWGGQNTCTFTSNGCGVTWVMDQTGRNFKVLHHFTTAEGHGASLIQGSDGFFYGCTVWPAAVDFPSGVLYRLTREGHFQVLYTFSQTNPSGQNMDGADSYEPLVETKRGVFYGAAYYGGTNGNGVVFRYSVVNPGVVEVVHDFSALNAAGQNWDGAAPDGPLTVGPHGILYSNANGGGENGSGVIYSVRENGHFEVLHAFTATDPITGANYDGALPDDGLVLDGNKLIGVAVYGGNGSPAGYYNSGGTLYELKLDTR